MQGILIENLGLDFVKTCFTYYWGDILFIGIYFAGILYFLIKKDNVQKYISIYTVFLFATIFNPVLVTLAFESLGQDEVYYRFFWLLPVNLVIAYLFTDFTTAFTSKAKRLGAFCICLCVILLLGSPVVYASKLIKLPDNSFKVSDEVLEISEYIHADSDEENPKIATESKLLMVIRQYDASLHLALDRDYVLCWEGYPQFQSRQKRSDYPQQKAIMDVIYGGDTSNSDEFLKAIEETGTDYLVFDKNIGVHDYLHSLEILPIAETLNFIIYSI